MAHKAIEIVFMTHKAIEIWLQKQYIFEGVTSIFRLNPLPLWMLLRLNQIAEKNFDDTNFRERIIDCDFRILISQVTR